MNIINTLSFLTESVCQTTDGSALSNVVVVVVYYIQLALKIIQIAVPIALILWGSIDMAKAVIAGDEKKMKEARKPLIQRVISAVVVFLIPFLVNLVMNLVDLSTTSDYAACWNDVKNLSSSDIKGLLDDGVSTSNATTN